MNCDEVLGTGAVGMRWAKSLEFALNWFVSLAAILLAGPASLGNARGGSLGCGATAG